MPNDGSDRRTKTEVFDDLCLFEAQKKWEESVGLRQRRSHPGTGPGAVAPPQSYSRMYPFTKGMILTNEAVAYGEIVLQDVGWFGDRASHRIRLRTLRTRTGVVSLGLAPSSPSPTSTPDPPPEGRRVRPKRRSK